MILNNWYAIANSKEIKKNKLLSIKRLNMNIVLFRDDNNIIKAVVDKCSHRGAQISKGRITNNCIQCPFHGLEFDGNGNCIKIPAQGKNFQNNLSRFNIKHFIIKEINDIVFIWYGENEPTKEIPIFKEIDNENLVFKEINDIWNTHYSRVIENQLDTIHLPFVHHNTIGRGNKTLINGPKTFWIDDITLLTSANNEVDHGQKPLKPKESIIKKTYLKFKMPNIWLNTISDKIFILIFFVPIDNNNTKLYIRFYNNITKFKTLNKFIAFFGKYMNNIVQKQDKRIVITQSPKISGLKINENLLQGDIPIIEYRKKRELLKNNK